MEVRVCSYNVLSERLCSPAEFCRCEPRHLTAALRHKRIERKLSLEMERQSILCLQEVTISFADRLAVFFESRGYHLTFSSYAGSTTGYMGVAIAYPRHAYVLEQQHVQVPSDTRWVSESHRESRRESDRESRHDPTGRREDAGGFTRMSTAHLLSPLRIFLHGILAAVLFACALLERFVGCEPAGEPTGEATASVEGGELEEMSEGGSLGRDDALTCAASSVQSRYTAKFPLLVVAAFALACEAAAATLCSLCAAARPERGSSTCGDAQWLALLQRAANRILVLRLRTRSSGTCFWIGTVHFPCNFKCPPAMVGFAALSAQIVQRLAGSEPCILAGDMNILPDSSAYALLSTGHCPDGADRPSLRRLREFGQRCEWRPELSSRMRSAYVVATGAEPELTNHAATRFVHSARTKPRHFTGTLDYIFMSEEWEGASDAVRTPTQHELRAERRVSYPDAFEPSDHVLIGATLSLAKRAEGGPECKDKVM
tara:strand:+ start:2039 stop:3499 length:1461 start_codon:yes stop_codon:yes gene_type:complete